VQGRHKNKVVTSVEAALAELRDGMTIMVGGFGLTGNPEALIKGVAERGPRELTLISNNAGALGKGLALWLKAGLIRRVICSYLGTNEELHKRMASGEVKVEVTPQGTLAERMRAAGAGIPAFYTPTGVGTVVEDGKETRVFDGKTYLLERALGADLALIRAHRADHFGNLRFWRTSRNFAPAMAAAADTTIAEVDELVPNGAIDPDDVHLPGLFVHRVLEIREHENPIEFRTVRPRPEKV
jgi:3-oxoacid CoA-transferase subunit A